MRKWYSLIDKVYAEENLKKAYDKVSKSRGSRTCGIDGMSIKAFTDSLGSNLKAIREALVQGDYRPSAVRGVYIEKTDGSKRPLGIPTITDRIVQQALLNVLEPIFEPHFHPSSYGYRSGRSAHHAVAKADAFSRKYGLAHVSDMDLSKCFDTLDHDLILRGVNRRVSDGKVLKLISLMLKSGYIGRFRLSPYRARQSSRRSDFPSIDEHISG